jgi:uncharacterized membrane protein YjfL (UPF0719 family)
MTLTGSPVLSSIVFAAVGIVIFVVAFALLDKLTPYKLWEEINIKNNVALAIVVGSGLIGLAMIISAAIHG